MTDTATLVHRIALASMRSLTPELARAIMERLEGLEMFFTLSERQLSSVMGFNSRLFADDIRHRALAEAEKEEVFVSNNSVRALFFTDPDYPQRLLQCDDAPLMLYALGEIDFNKARFISIVGTRHATAYGIDFVRDTIAGLNEKMSEPLVVVSGLAYGIDIAAHRGALQAGVPTVGVVAHGLNTIYPAVHRDTAARMVRNGGAIVSEYRSADAVHRGNFLARNRIVAGLSDCLLVAESDSKGGALVTANIAASYNRDVMALPGRHTDRYSRGCNALIASNIAQLICSADDIISAMGWPVREAEGSQPELFIELSPEEEAVCNVLRQMDDASLSDILARVDIPIHRLMSLLIDMEYKNLLTALPGSRYRAI